MKIYAEITGENLKAATDDGQEVDSAVESMEQAVETEHKTEPEVEEAGAVKPAETSGDEHKEE